MIMKRFGETTGDCHKTFQVLQTFSDRYFNCCLSMWRGCLRGCGPLEVEKFKILFELEPFAEQLNHEQFEGREPHTDKQISQLVSNLFVLSCMHHILGGV